MPWHQRRSREIIDQRRRRIFPATLELGRDSDFPAGAAQQGRFDEIVAEDVTAERRVARQYGQSAILHERFDANDRVMALVIAVLAGEPGKPGDVNWAVYPRGKLLHTREQRFTADKQWRRLHERNARM